MQQFAWRTGDYEQLRARATTKDDVKLGNIPNAISDDPDSDSSVILATTKAVKASASVIWNAIANIVSGTTIVGRAAKLATARRIKVTGAATGAADFDGSADVTLTVATTQATEGVAGGARVATQVQTNEGVDDAAYITAKKLRWGFAVSLTPNGYIAFPSWLSGLIIQWGFTPAVAIDTNVPTSFPLAFPTACRSVVPQASNPTASGELDSGPQLMSITPTTFTCRIQNYVGGVGAPHGFYWLAIGH